METVYVKRFFVLDKDKWKIIRKTLLFTEDTYSLIEFPKHNNDIMYKNTRKSKILQIVKNYTKIAKYPFKS